MTVVPPRHPAGAPPARRGDDATALRRRRALVATYGTLGALLVAYVVSLLARTPAQQWTWLDGWGVAAFEVLASGACLARALLRRPGRAVALFLGASLLAWALGDVFLTVESLGGANPPTPSTADAFYLAFYPCAYVALVLLLRRQARTIAPRSWLDGAIAGLGAAAVCAAFAFHGIAHSAGGHAVSVATNLAYPIGDLLLLALAMGGAAVVAAKARVPWVLLAAGIACNAVGDTFNVFPAGGSSQVGVVFNAGAWPTATVLLSLAVWTVPERSELLAPERTPGFALPGLAAIAGLGVLLVGGLHTVSRVALGLAAGTLAVVGVRLVVSVRSLRALTVERHRQAVTDELTGLGNRRLLFDVLDRFFADHVEGRGAADEPASALAFLFIDLNRFKEINDSFGHPAGDELLRKLGPRLRASLRPGDVPIRLGGDEFGALLLDADAAAAVAVAQRVADTLSEPFVLGGVTAHIGASIGVALAPGDAVDVAGLMWCADVAMYRAKLGGSEVALYDQGLDEGEDHLSLAADLRAAVEAGAFVIHYQPQLDLRTGRVVAVEALVRWPHPRLGLIPPLKFLPLAEEAGLMRILTMWVLDSAMAQAAAWRASGHELTMSVNVAASDLLEPGLFDIVVEGLDRYRLPSHALVLEVTETGIIKDFERSRQVIEHLRDAGVIVSIDDFGAGFTSLAYLSGLAVGELKLDRTFVTGLSGTDKQRDLELVRATIHLGHAMGLRVVAEGIEDDATLSLLSELGCDLAQGYFIGRPLPATDLAFRAGDPAAHHAAAI